MAVAIIPVTGKYARACRKSAYPWLVERLLEKFVGGGVAGAEASSGAGAEGVAGAGAIAAPSEVAQIDFAALREELACSEMPPHVRGAFQHIRLRHMKEQYVRCVLYPKRSGNMVPAERESVLRVAREDRKSVV